MIITLFQASLVLVLASFAAARCPDGTLQLYHAPPGICVPGPNGCPQGSVRKVVFVYPVGRNVIICNGCGAGSTTYQNDALLCRRIGYPCPKGHHETDSGDCWRCEADQYFDFDQDRCVSCPSGTGAAPGLARACAPCSRMLERGITRSNCVRDDWFASQGGNCPLGSRVVSRDSLNIPICEKCQPGSFSAERNPTQCTECPAGLVASEEGAQSCEPCLPGKKPNDDRTQCVQADTGCSEDQKPATMDGKNFCRSTRCGNGDNSIEAVYGRTCGPCKKNGFVTTKGFYPATCSTCPVDTLSDGLTCTKCPRGQVRMEDKRCGCRGPLALNRGVDADGNCVKCKPGSRGVPGPDGENVCTKCPAGTWLLPRSDMELANCVESTSCNPFKNPCEPCRAGMTSGPGTLAFGCKPCPEGSYSYGLGSRCLREGEPSAPVPFTDPFGDSVVA